MPTTYTPDEFLAEAAGPETFSPEEFLGARPAVRRPPPPEEATTLGELPGVIGDVASGLGGAAKRGLLLTTGLPAALELGSLPSQPSAHLRYKQHLIDQQGRGFYGEPPVDILGEHQARVAQRVAANQLQVQATPQSTAQTALGEAQGAGEQFAVWLKNPVELTASIILESLPPSLAGAAVGTVAGGPGAGTATGVGVSSLATTYATELLGAAQQQGVDLSDPAALTAWVQSPEFDLAADASMKKAAIIGGIDAVTAGKAGAFLKPAIGQGLKRVALASGKEVAMQMAGGAGGEALGEVAAGQKLDPFNIAMEAVAELGSAPGEVYSNLRGEAGGKAESRKQKAEMPAGTTLPQPGTMSPEEFAGAQPEAVGDAVERVPTTPAPDAPATKADLASLAQDLQATLLRNQIGGAKAESGKQKAEIDAGAVRAERTAPDVEQPAAPAPMPAEPVAAALLQQQVAAAAQPPGAKIEDGRSKMEAAPSSILNPPSSTAPVAEPTEAAAAKDTGYKRGQFFRVIPELAGQGPDILNDIQQLGGLQFIQTAKNPKAGEWDGHYRQGEASFIYKQGGMAPDLMLQALQQMGHRRLESTGDLWDAIRDAAEIRSRIKDQGGTEEEKTDRFWSAVDPEKKKGLTKINADELTVGDTFYFRGKGYSNEALEVTGVNPDTGEVTVKDGPVFGWQTLPAGTEIWVKERIPAWKAEAGKAAKMEDGGSKIEGAFAAGETPEEWSYRPPPRTGALDFAEGGKYGEVESSAYHRQMNPIGPQSGGTRWGAIENEYIAAKAAAEALPSVPLKDIFGFHFKNNKTGEVTTFFVPRSKQRLLPESPEIRERFPVGEYTMSVSPGYEPYRPQKGEPSFREWLAGQRPGQPRQPDRFAAGEVLQDRPAALDGREADLDKIAQDLYGRTYDELTAEQQGSVEVTLESEDAYAALPRRQPADDAAGRLDAGERAARVAAPGVAERRPALPRDPDAAELARLPATPKTGIADLYRRWLEQRPAWRLAKENGRTALARAPKRSDGTVDWQRATAGQVHAIWQGEQARLAEREGLRDILQQGPVRYAEIGKPDQLVLESERKRELWPVQDMARKHLEEVWPSEGSKVVHEVREGGKPVAYYSPGGEVGDAVERVPAGLTPAAGGTKITQAIYDKHQSALDSSDDDGRSAPGVRSGSAPASEGARRPATYETQTQAPGAGAADQPDRGGVRPGWEPFHVRRAHGARELRVVAGLWPGVYRACRHDVAAYESAFGRQLADLAARHGARVVFYRGPATASAGQSHQGTILLRTDRPLADIRQTLEHELWHHNVRRNNPHAAPLHALVDLQSPAAQTFRAGYDRWLTYHQLPALSDAAAREELCADFVSGKGSNYGAELVEAFADPEQAEQLAVQYHGAPSDSAVRIPHSALPGPSRAGGNPTRANAPPGGKAESGKQKAEMGLVRASNAVITPPGYAQQLPLLAVSAHHGTPHKVDRFTTAKIGTGEGAQVYGWGLYFAESYGVAKSYQQNLKRREVRYDGEPFQPDNPKHWAALELDTAKAAGRDRRSALQTIRATAQFANNEQERKRYEEAAKLLEEGAEAKIEVTEQGNLYTVRLNVEPEELLDWDKPLSEQLPEVREKLEPAVAAQRAEFNKRGPTVARDWGEVGNPDIMRGADIHAQLRRDASARRLEIGKWLWDGPNDDEAAARSLQQLGIKGIRYLDQGSRNARAETWSRNDEAAAIKAADQMRAEGYTDVWHGYNERTNTWQVHGDEPKTYNYVIFDERDIEITHENGQPVTMAQAQAQQAQFAAGDTGGDPREPDSYQRALHRTVDKRLRERLERLYPSLQEQPDFALNAPESVAEQKAREKAEAESRKQKAEMERRRERRLTGEDLDTTQEMFGAETRRDKSGQGALFAAGEVPDEREQSAINYIRNKLWENDAYTSDLADTLSRGKLSKYGIVDVESALWDIGEKRNWQEILDDEGDAGHEFEHARAAGDPFTAAKQHHGTTDDIAEAGYVLPDGTLLDFSGKREGGSGGTRANDHRQIQYPGRPSDGYEAMQGFMDLGAVRMDGNSGAVDMTRKPTEAQLRRIREVGEAADGLLVDMVDGKRRASFETSNPAKALGQIRAFYAGRDLPEHQTLFAPGDVPGEGAPRTWQELQTETARLQEQLRDDFHALGALNQDDFATLGEYADAKRAVRENINQTTASLRLAQSELRSAPGYVRDLLLKFQAASEAAKMEDGGSKIEGAPTRSDARFEMEALDGELQKCPARLVNAIYERMQRNGELPASAPLPEGPRTLSAMVEWMTKQRSDSPSLTVREQLRLGQRAAEAAAEARAIGGRLWQQMRGLTAAAWERFLHPVTDDNFRSVHKDFIAADTYTGLETKRFVDTLERMVPSPLRQQAISIFNDAQGDAGLLKYWADAVPERFVPIFKAAQHLTPFEKSVAERIQADFEDKRQAAIDAGFLQTGREDYGMPQVWRVPPKPPEEEGSTFAEGDRKRSAGNPRARLDPRDPFFALRREHDTYFGGIMAGGIPADLRASRLVGTYNAAFHKALNSRQFIWQLKDAEAADGSPVVKISGNATRAPLEKGGALLVDSKARSLSDTTQDGRPYKPVNHWALRDWKFVGKDDRGRPVLVRGEFLVHPDHVREVTIALDQKSALRNPEVVGRPMAAVFNALLSSSAFAKASLYAGATFHGFTLGEHMFFHAFSGLPTRKRLGLFNVLATGVEMDPAKNPALQRLMRGGLKVSSTPEELNLMSEGLAGGGGLIERVPGVGEAFKWMKRQLFEEWKPRAMVKLGEALLEANDRRYGHKYTPDQIAELTADEVSAALGGQNSRLLLHSKTFTDFNRLIFGAPDFLLSRAKVVGTAFQPWKHREQTLFLLAQAALGYAIARLLNKLFDDDWHWEAENAFAVVSDKRRYSARLIVQDVQHLVTDPKGFAAGRTGPWPRALYEGVSERDMRTGARIEPVVDVDNKTLRSAEIAVQSLLRWGVPVSFQGLLPDAPGREETGLGQLSLAQIGVGKRKYTSNTEVWAWAADWMKDSSDPATILARKAREDETRRSAYRKLDALLDGDKLDAARSEYDALVKEGHKPRDIYERYSQAVGRPFTGRKDREAQFYQSLDAQQQAIYKDARKERAERLARFERMARKKD